MKVTNIKEVAEGKLARVKARKAKSNPEQDKVKLKLLRKKVEEHKAFIANSASDLQSLYNSIAEVNCNIHPLKQNVKADWQYKLGEILENIARLHSEM